MEKKDGKMKTIIGGDFNARTGKIEREIRREEEEEREKSGWKSRDKKINADEKLLLNRTEKFCWVVLMEI